MQLLDLLKQTTVGSTPTCLGCFSAEDVLGTHLITPERSALRWLDVLWPLKQNEYPARCGFERRGAHTSRRP